MISIQNSLQVFQNIQKTKLFHILQMQSRRGWTTNQDDRLTKIIKKFGTKNWPLISDKLFLVTEVQRTGKQCRERWYNHLNPDIVSKSWSYEQIQRLFKAHRQLGSRWKQISQMFPGRTDNSIKNQFYSTVRRCLRKINRLRGDKNSTINMKTVKPSVLSKIVENTELTNLIVRLGKGRTQHNDSFNESLQEGQVQKIQSQMKRITLQYDNQKELQHRKKSNSIESSKQIQFSNSNQSIVIESEEDKLYKKDKLKEIQIQKMEIFEQKIDNLGEQRQSMINDTHYDSKSKHEQCFNDENKDSNMLIVADFNMRLDYQKDNEYLQMKSSLKYENDENFSQQNFFISPSYGRALPQLGLFHKQSHNSQSPRFLQKQEKSNKPKFYFRQKETIEIHFDPQSYFNQSLDQQKDDQLE